MICKDNGCWNWSKINLVEWTDYVVVDQFVIDYPITAWKKKSVIKETKQIDMIKLSDNRIFRRSRFE